MPTLEGIVISSKTPQTVIVTIGYTFRHPKYKKILKRTTKLAVHNEISEVKIGDKVRLVKSRPYSKTKHFQVVEIIGRGTAIPEVKTAPSAKKPKVKPIKKKSKKI